MLSEESKHWDEFEKEIIEDKKIIPWWLDVRNASKYTKDGKFFFDPQREELIRGKFWKKIINSCRQGESVLDVGCGSGWLSLELARRGCHVTAIDVSAYRVNLGKKYYEEKKKEEGFSGTINYLVGDVLSADIPQLDAIVAWDSLHHLPDLDNLLNRLDEKLKPDGRLVCYDHLGSKFIGSLGNIRRIFVKEKVSAFEDVSQEEIMVYIKKHFSIKEIKYKITAPFRLIDFLFFQYKISKLAIVPLVRLDEFVADNTKLFGREFVYVEAVKKNQDSKC